MYIQKLKNIAPAHARRDLEIDEQLLAKYDAVGARWLWVLTRVGQTVLVRLGVHPRESSWGFAALKSAATILLLEKGRATEVDEERAKSLLSDMEYETKDRLVLRGREKIATYRTVPHPERLNQPAMCEVDFSLCIPANSLDLTALRFIGAGIAVEEMGTLFTRMQIRVNGLNIDEAVDEHSDFIVPAVA